MEIVCSWGQRAVSCPLSVYNLMWVWLKDVIWKHERSVVCRGIMTNSVCPKKLFLPLNLFLPSLQGNGANTHPAVQIRILGDIPDSSFPHIQFMIKFCHICSEIYLKSTSTFPATTLSKPSVPQASPSNWFPSFLYPVRPMYKEQPEQVLWSMKLNYDIWIDRNCRSDYIEW